MQHAYNHLAVGIVCSHLTPLRMRFAAASMQVQLIRIQVRVPEYGWTTQKVFHLLNCLVCSLRAGVSLFRPQLETLQPEIFKEALLDFPGARGGGARMVGRLTPCNTGAPYPSSDMLNSPVLCPLL